MSYRSIDFGIYAIFAARPKQPKLVMDWESDYTHINHSFSTAFDDGVY